MELQYTSATVTLEMINGNGRTAVLGLTQNGRDLILLILIALIFKIRVRRVVSTLSESGREHFGWDLTMKNFRLFVKCHHQTKGDCFEDKRDAICEINFKHSGVALRNQ